MAITNLQIEGKLLYDLRQTILQMAKERGVEIDALDSRIIPVLQKRIGELEELQESRAGEDVEMAIYFMRMLIRGLAN